jgi:Protein of unknown function (DUF1097)
MMSNLTALSFSIGILAGVATFLALGPLEGYFFIWAATIAWAAYFALGGNQKALKDTVICGIFGIFMAWVTAIEITLIPSTFILGLPVMSAIIVTLAVVVMCLASILPKLSAIPASVLGYSSTFAFLLQTPDKLNQEMLLSATFHNPLIVISLSFIIGAMFGVSSARLGILIESLNIPDVFRKSIKRTA